MLHLSLYGIIVLELGYINSKNMSNNSKVIGALLVGAAAGAVLGILFAPEKGQDTRKKILDGANGLSDDLKERINAGKGLIDELVSRLVESSENLMHKAEEGVGYAKYKAKETSNQL